MDGLVNLIKPIWWEILAIVIAPFAAVMVTQHAKNIHKRFLGKKPHWLLLDWFSFAVCLALSYLCWQEKYANTSASLLVAIMVATLHTVIVKWMFRAIGNRYPKLAQELKDGVDLDHYNTRTIMKAIVLGKREDKD